LRSFDIADSHISENPVLPAEYLIDDILGKNLFEYAKPTTLLKLFIQIATNQNDIILDFFAGSGTTGHAVMQLNAEDGGNRKFILCQIDEPIKDETSCLFCEENGLPPVISSLTCERLRRSGDKILKEIEEQNAKTGFFEENKQLLPDIGYKVFDLTNAPKLSMSDNGIVELFDNPELTPIDRIYNLIFKVGVDNPAVAPVEIIKDCMYVGANNQDEIPNYYITNSAEIDKPENKDKFKTALQTGKVYIDGWTATLNTTLQETKDKEDRGKIWVVF
jgi:adenine-specific DNA-methyltransferase